MSSVTIFVHEYFLYQELSRNPEKCSFISWGLLTRRFQSPSFGMYTQYSKHHHFLPDMIEGPGIHEKKELRSAVPAQKTQSGSQDFFKLSQIRH